MTFINSNLKISTFGGTHEKEIGVMISGFPADFEIDMDSVQDMLDRRRPGQSELTTKRNEDDIPLICSGIEGDKTTGDVIKVSFENKDIKNADDDKDFVPRPGHGDFTYYCSSGEFNKGATSARSTVGIVFAGAMCKQFLAEHGIFVNAKLVYPDKEIIKKAAAEGDSVGGIVEGNIIGLAAGFGDLSAGKIESRIAACIFNIQGVKGLEFGLGFEAAELRGSEMNDPFVVGEDGKVRTATNNCGGLLGGLATGSPVTFNVAFKPTPTIAKEQQSVNLKTLQPVSVESKKRSDPCIALRGSVVVEAAAAIAAADIILGQE